MKAIRVIVLLVVAFVLVVVAVAMGVYFGNQATTVLGSTATDPYPICSSIYLSPEYAATPRVQFMTDCRMMIETITAMPTLDMELIQRRAACSKFEELATTNPDPYNACMGTKTP